MNTVRITAIPVAHEIANYDLAEGMPHEILGYTTMAIALLLLLSTIMRLYGYLVTRHLVKESKAKRQFTMCCFDSTFGCCAHRNACALCICVLDAGARCLQLMGAAAENVDFFRNDVLIDIRKRTLRLTCCHGTKLITGARIVKEELILVKGPVCGLIVRAHVWEYCLSIKRFLDGTN